MKIVMLPPQGPDEDVGLPGEPVEAASGGEYVMTFPVPGPEEPGEYVFLTLTPDGRPAAVMVDDVVCEGNTVEGRRRLPGSYQATTGQWSYSTVAKLPKEAPWMMLRRELLRYTTKAEARRAMAEVYRGMLGGQNAQSCPVHGDVHPLGEEPAPGAEVDDRRGYL